MPDAREFMEWLASLTPSELVQQCQRHGIRIYSDPLGALWYQVDVPRFRDHHYDFDVDTVTLARVLLASAPQLQMLLTENVILPSPSDEIH